MNQKLSPAVTGGSLSRDLVRSIRNRPISEADRVSASLFLLLSREAWHLSNLAQEPVYLISGFYFPIKSFSFWIAASASLIPLTLGLDAMRQLVFPSGPALGFVSVQIELIVLVLLSLVFLVAAKFLLDYIEKLAIREGRLTESRR